MSVFGRLRRQASDAVPVFDLDITPPPHCDQAVLHAPGECKYCDECPDWQALRQLWGIAFTGHAPRFHEVPCPSDARRPDGVNQLWPGNQPRAVS